MKQLVTTEWLEKNINKITKSKRIKGAFENTLKNLGYIKN